MNENSKAIYIFCSRDESENNALPFTPTEWFKFSHCLFDNNLEPKDVLNFSDSKLNDVVGLTNSKKITYERLKKLLDRSGSVSFVLQKYSKMGINIVTKADRLFPFNLKTKLKSTCPPFFYYSGNLDLLKNRFIGFVGSRNIDNTDIEFTTKIVNLANSKSFGVVSGGAKGVDETSIDSSLKNGFSGVGFVSDSLKKKIRRPETRKYIEDGRLLLLSCALPESSFNIGMAMNRNKYIYAQSVATVVVKSDYNKGGTWAGANECINKSLAPLYCWNNNLYKGNIALIDKGANPIDEDWNLEIDKSEKPVQYTIDYYLSSSDQ